MAGTADSATVVRVSKLALVNTRRELFACTGLHHAGCPVLRLTYERKARGWFQADVAHLAELYLGNKSRLRHQSIIARLELSQTLPTEAELEALATIFEISPAFLLLREVGEIAEPVR